MSTHWSAIDRKWKRHFSHLIIVFSSCSLGRTCLLCNAISFLFVCLSNVFLLCENKYFILISYYHIILYFIHILLFSYSFLAFQCMVYVRSVIKNKPFIDDVTFFICKYMIPLGISHPRKQPDSKDVRAISIPCQSLSHGKSHKTFINRWPKICNWHDDNPPTSIQCLCSADLRQLDNAASLLGRQWLTVYAERMIRLK